MNYPECNCPSCRGLRNLFERNRTQGLESAAERHRREQEFERQIAHERMQMEAAGLCIRKEILA